MSTPSEGLSQLLSDDSSLGLLALDDDLLFSDDFSFCIDLDWCWLFFLVVFCLFDELSLVFTDFSRLELGLTVLFGFCELSLFV